MLVSANGDCVAWFSVQLDKSMNAVFGASDKEDGAEFTLRIVMAHLFRNASFRVTTFISICP